MHESPGICSRNINGDGRKALDFVPTFVDDAPHAPIPAVRTWYWYSPVKIQRCTVAGAGFYQK